MDITSRYRTKFPPKEHEEAVKMLLENIGTKQAPLKAVNGTNTREHRYDYDRQSLNSNNSESSNDQAILKKRNNSNMNGLTGRQIINGNNNHNNKETSTCDSVSSVSSSSIELENAHKEPIPSRTIAVQCDLKSSSLKRDHLFDTSMQASSISSTRYGFYNFSPETLARRRRLERSISSRDVAQPKQVASGQLRSQIEAPTSMSELSSSLSAASDYELNETRNRDLNGSRRGFELNRRAVERPMAPTERSGELLRANGNNRQSDLNGKASLYGSMVDNSTGGAARTSTLPRRPVTALSYVSTTRLRGQQQPETGSADYSSDQESELSPRVRSTLKNRAMSQQALSRARTPAPGNHGIDDDATSCSGSSELENDRAAPSLATNNRFSADGQSIGYQGDRSTDEILVTKGVVDTAQPPPPPPIKPPRPTLVSSAHNEQVRDYDSCGAPAGNRSHNRDYAFPARTTERPSLGVQSNFSSSWRELSGSESAAKGQPTYKSRQVNDQAMQAESLRRAPRRQVRDATSVQDENYNSYDERNPSYWKRTVSQLPDHQVSVGPKYFASDDERKYNQRYNGKLINGRPHNSMSLTRGRSQASIPQRPSPQATGGYYTSGRSPANSALNKQRTNSQTLRAKSRMYTTPSEEANSGRHLATNHIANDVCRSTSMRQIGRQDESYETQHYPSNQFQGDYDYEQDRYYEDDDTRAAGWLNRNNGNGAVNKDKLLLETRTWHNPSSKLITPQVVADEIGPSKTRRCSRSRSMRNVHDPSDYELTNYRKEHYASQANELHRNHSGSSESSVLDDEAQPARLMRTQPLDYDSQHRLNESGLPEINHSMTMQPARKASAPSFYLSAADHQARPSYTLGRGANIKGRAMSQQSLTRPTMPLLAGRRRRQPTGTGSNSGSDVGGSSMSLVSRLNGQYENAHTRNPVVMYIPQVVHRSSNNLDRSKSTLEANKSSLLRKSSRIRSKSSSQDRLKRSQSRNGSDSESSSMLRTLLRPKSRNQANNSSSRVKMHNMMLEYRQDDDEEDLDRIGHLATELDSYKFRRRYSVPKDAKINWFAKLKQKVSSSGR